MDVELIVTKGLGDNTYLMGSEGEAALVDPQRDMGRFLEAARARGLSIRHVLETHVHNDYLSGAVEVRAATGAEIDGPAGGQYRFPFHPMAEGDEVRIGAIRLVAMETPGHTPEHVSYVAFEEGADRPVAVFTGGSMMVGTAGRTDLLGADQTDALTRAQYRSLRRLAELPGEVEVFPTHGAGSFCGAVGGTKGRTSTVETERMGNVALLAADEEAFVRQQLHGLMAYPTYYGHMASINRSGPRPLADVRRPGPLSPDAFEARVAAGATAVDGRGRRAFAQAHVPGSINVELEGSFASYIGWLVPFDAPIVLVLPSPESEAAEEAFTQLIRIGYERMEGFLEGGVESWRASGRSVGSHPTGGVDDLCRAYRRGARVLDVRQGVEWDAAHIPGSVHVFVADLPARMEAVPKDGDLWVVCASGQRSSIAASLLDGAGIASTTVTEGGVDDFLRICPPA